MDRGSGQGANLSHLFGFVKQPRGPGLLAIGYCRDPDKGKRGRDERGGGTFPLAPNPKNLALMTPRTPAAESTDTVTCPTHPAPKHVPSIAVCRALSWASSEQARQGPCPPGIYTALPERKEEPWFSEAGSRRQRLPLGTVAPGLCFLFPRSNSQRCCSFHEPGRPCP